MADAESPRRRRRNRSRACEPGRYLTGFGRGAILTQTPEADHSTEPAARGRGGPPFFKLSTGRAAAVEMVNWLVVVVVGGAGGSPVGASSLGAFGAGKAWSFHASQGALPGWWVRGFVGQPLVGQHGDFSFPHVGRIGDLGGNRSRGWSAASSHDRLAVAKQDDPLEALQTGESSPSREAGAWMPG